MCHLDERPSSSSSAFLKNSGGNEIRRISPYIIYLRDLRVYLYRVTSETNAYMNIVQFGLISLFGHKDCRLKIEDHCLFCFHHYSSRMPLLLLLLPICMRKIMTFKMPPLFFKDAQFAWSFVVSFISSCGN